MFSLFRSDDVKYKSDLLNILRKIDDQIKSKTIKDDSVRNQLKAVKYTYIDGLFLDDLKKIFPSASRDLIYQWRTRGLKRVEKYASEDLKKWIRSVKYRKKNESINRKRSKVKSLLP